jgi:arylsulfatase A-like enzyme
MGISPNSMDGTRGFLQISAMMRKFDLCASAGLQLPPRSYRGLQRGAAFLRSFLYFIGFSWATAGSLVGAQVATTNLVSQPPPAPRRPNIILIVADDLGYGDLGCYGQTRIKTPNLDKMASEGLRFTSFYAGSTVCAPSRCCLMTGLDTGHAFIRGNGTQALRSSDTTIAELLHQAGYHTGLIGKWGLGNENSTGMPREKGFDEFVGYLDHVHAHDYYTDRLWRWDSRTGYNDWEVFPENQGKKELYMPDLFTKCALNFLSINKPDDFNHHRSFFLYLAYTLPHANNEEQKLSGNGMQVPNDAPYSNEAWPQPEKNKAAMITRLDDYVGQILAKLQELKLDDNTIVLFSSDNGPHKEGGVDPNFFHSSGPFRGYKRDLYEGGIRVPLIVRWPAKIKKPAIVDTPWAFWDFLPTAAEIATAKLPPALNGISFLPTLMGRTQTNHHDTLYWEFHERGFQQAIRMGHWKAVRLQAGAALELYDLNVDPAEKNNIAGEHADVIAQAENYFRTARTESGEWPIHKPEEKAERTGAAKTDERKS